MKFKFSYDKENDDLFAYLPKKKSGGAVEIGNFVLDFDKNKNLVAIQITNAAETLSKIVPKIIRMDRIKEFKAKVVNFRNTAIIRLEISLDSGKTEPIRMLIPRIKEKSPALISGYSKHLA